MIMRTTLSEKKKKKQQGITPVMEKEHTAQPAATALWQGGHEECEIAASELVLRAQGL